MMRMFRQAAMVSKNGIFWRTFGQTLEVVAAISSAIVPVLVALQTQTDKRDDPEWYWGLTGSTVALSVIATICMVVERTRGMKEQGIRERMAGADQLYHLKLFLACSVEDGYTSDYRKSFATLSKRMAKMQFKGTSDVYVPPWPAAAHPARGPPRFPPPLSHNPLSHAILAFYMSPQYNHGYTCLRPGRLQERELRRPP